MATEADILLLAAGFGERLRPLTLRVPKPLLPIYGVPLLDTQIDQIDRSKVRIGRIVINAHHLVDRIVEHVARHPAHENLTLSIEPNILGTGGGIAQAAGWLRSDPFFVLNADALFPLPLEEALAFHSRHDFDATMVLIDSEIRRNVVVEDERVAAILPDRVDSSGWTFTGLHVVSRRLVSHLPVGQFHDIRDTYQRLSAEGRLGAYRWPRQSDQTFLDVGTPHAYLQAHRLLTAGRDSGFPAVARRAAEIIHATGYGYLEPDVVSGEQSRVARSVILHGARVAPGITIEDSIVGPGVTVTEDTFGQLVTLDGMVPIAPELA